MSYFNDFRRRMGARRAKMRGKKEFKQAAITYVCVRLAMLLLSYAFVSCSECDFHPARQGIRFIIVTLFLWSGTRITSSLIAFVSVFRGTAYLLSFFSINTFLLHMPVMGVNFNLFTEHGSGHWVFLLNAILMYTLAAMVIRAIIARMKKTVEELEEAPASELETLKHA